jgi:5'-nucleotidase
MNILLSNDDGAQAPGLAALYRALAPHADVITVVAPDRNRSAASNSLTIDSPIRVRQLDNGFYAVNGTPTDSVHLAITGLLDVEPDMVISGINEGGNLGDDVLYSGTVAAAMEGRFLGLPAIAVSLVGDTFEHYDTAGDIIAELIQNKDLLTDNRDSILNVNVPNLPRNQIKGIKACRLGSRHKAEPIIRQHDPRGKPLYWVGPAGAEQDAGEGTDFHAIRQGYVAVTPLHTDLSCYRTLEKLKTQFP